MGAFFTLALYETAREISGFVVLKGRRNKPKTDR